MKCKECGFDLIGAIHSHFNSTSNHEISLDMIKFKICKFIDKNFSQNRNLSNLQILTNHEEWEDKFLKKLNVEDFFKSE